MKQEKVKCGYNNKTLIIIFGFSKKNLTEKVLRAQTGRQTHTEYQPLNWDRLTGAGDGFPGGACREKKYNTII